MSRLSSDVVKTLLRTEKGTEASVYRKYFFEVAVGATKPEIHHAVEELFKVKVQAVNTSHMRGKPRRMGRHQGWKSNWKRAIVTLKEGQSIKVAN
jgi:large subunit ribosomal protein L23